MNILLWILQCILGLKFLSIAYSHGLRQDQEKMRQGIRRMGPRTRPLLFLVAFFSLACAAGLTAPAVIRTPAWLTPLAAAALALLILLSAALHFACREKPLLLPSLVLFAMSAFVAYGRWALSPF